MRFPVFSVAYSYVAASWLVYCWDRWISPRPSMRRWMMMLPMAIQLILTLPPLFGLLLGGAPAACPSCRPLPSLLLLLSTLITAYPVLLLYVVSCYGLYRVASERLSSR